ncbi:MAG: hypothetical protein MJ231_02270 [bacterium]|nr:hypothetical protein [bacterium]
MDVKSCTIDKPNAKGIGIFKTYGIKLINGTLKIITYSNLHNSTIKKYAIEIKIDCIM